MLDFIRGEEAKGLQRGAWPGTPGVPEAAANPSEYLRDVLSSANSGQVAVAWGPGQAQQGPGPQ